MPFTTYLDQRLVEYAFGAAAFTPPADYYLGLSSSAPTQAAGSGTWNFSEPAIGTNGYARVQLGNTGSVFVAAATQPTGGFVVQIAPAVSFPESTGPWSSGVALEYFGLFDAATGGNLVGYGQLTPSLTVVVAGYIPEFPAGQLTIELV